MDGDPLATAALLSVGVLAAVGPTLATVADCVAVAVDGVELVGVVRVRGSVLAQVSLVVHAGVVGRAAGVVAVTVVVEAQDVADLLAEDMVRDIPGVGAVQFDHESGVENYFSPGDVSVAVEVDAGEAEVGSGADDRGRVSIAYRASKQWMLGG